MLNPKNLATSRHAGTYRPVYEKHRDLRGRTVPRNGPEIAISLGSPPDPPVHPSLADAGNGVVEEPAWVEDQNGYSRYPFRYHVRRKMHNGEIADRDG